MMRRFFLYPLLILHFSFAAERFEELFYQEHYGFSLQTQFVGKSNLGTDALLPQGQISLQQNWLEPLFNENPQSPENETFLALKSRMILSSFFMEFNTGLSFKLLRWFEFFLKYENMYPFGSTVSLNAEGDNYRDNWNREFVSDHLYGEYESSYSHSFLIGYSFQIPLPSDAWQLRLFFVHSFNDLSDDTEGMVYDFRTDLPFSRIEDTGEFCTRLKWKKSPQWTYQTHLTYRVTQFRRQFLDDLTLFPSENQQYDSQINPGLLTEFHSENNVDFRFGLDYFLNSNSLDQFSFNQFQIELGVRKNYQF